jgi:cyclic beta-1,2-glucan synthetase
LKASSATVSAALFQLRGRLRRAGSQAQQADEERPLRSELFSADQMEQHGKSLAASHTLTLRRGADQLLPRLAANESVLVGACNLLTAAVTANRRITPAGEWLLDNFYLVEEQIRTSRRHLPRGYSRELPRLADGPSAGLPRVYDLALETISHGDGRVDTESLARFVAAYQTVTALTLGELWAIPIMLRLALIENLRRVVARTAAGRVDRDLADSWADQMTAMAEQDPKSLILVIADMARSSPPMTTPFVSELARRLQGQSPALALPLTWIEQRLSESGLTIEHLVQSGNQHQAADQVSISNSIGSLRFLGATDWREFVETMSVVERTLREDPCGVYGAMDFATRDRYRHAVERIAKGTHLTEGEVARKAIDLARDGAARDRSDDRAAHVGFYLIDKGSTQLERSARSRPAPIDTLRRAARQSPLLLYLGAIALITAILAGSLFAQGYVSGEPDWLLVTIGFLAVVSTSQIAVALVNWLATVLVTPHLLPRMDFSHGIPPGARALVVVPTMLSSARSIEDLVEALEVRFLANRDENLYFSLLTDFRDAQQETLPEDSPLLQLAAQRIDELNRKYRSAQDDAFFLFHRSRRWNARERVWMGYERKRGKLADLNALLRGGADRSSENSFSLIVGATPVLTGIKYVITLDTDTQLPRDSARQFVGTLAHPLNRARYDDGKRRVTEGYGILQPRVAASLPGTNLSRYAQLHGGDPGIDPYTRAVSDVYQDVFGEGSFIGKGIYDIDAFERALKDRLPEDRILSHDLLEGCYARAGLLSDVQLYEEYPSRYSEDVSRRYRWIRGDWQLVGWLRKRVPGPNGSREKNPLSTLSQWKIFDNLRRSVVPVALILLLLLGWMALSSPGFWTLCAIGIILIPSLSAAIAELLHKPSDVMLVQHLDASIRAAGRRFTQAALTLATLPYEAFVSLHAIARTAVRVLVTHKRLLEWNPSGGRDPRGDLGFVACFRSLWIAPVLACAAGVYLSTSKPAVLAMAAPILCLWFAAPAIAWWISRPLAGHRADLTTEETLFLRKVSRRTWSFFETFVGPQDHWLPPDNVQEHPVAAVAHRTSPTNMGLALLANLSAYDFGYIPGGELAARTADALRTMETLERHRGHFYNWYDTQSLKPLAPIYISTVDSGNLAGHLLTLAPGLRALAEAKILGPRVFEGLRDTFAILLDVAGGPARTRLAPLQKDLATACSSPPTTLATARMCLDRIGKSAAELAGDPATAPETEARWWALALARQCRSALDDLTFLAPWLALPAAPPGLNDMPGDTEIPTLREAAKLEAGSHMAVEYAPGAQATAAQTDWLSERRRLVEQGSGRARERLAAIEGLALQSSELARMEYDFLYDKGRHLMTIGYNVSEHRRDSSYYDLLASEARLCSFVAIAQGQVPQENWFALGRLLTAAGGESLLMSWSGSMFEYLMPLLVMPTYRNTLLDQTCRAAVQRQIEYGRQRGVAWGMSESGYNAVDVHLNYQYRAFGVPGLGLKRGLAEDVVIAPYASVLALMVAPEEACGNLQRLAGDGLLGKFGFYEAVDHTPSRLPRGQRGALVRSFMAHHQGMSLLSLAYLLLERPMQKRFESDPLFQATLLLLQERIPKATAFLVHAVELPAVRGTLAGPEMPVRILDSPDTAAPEVQLLSNGRYHVMLTNAGGGYSRWRDLAVTRWREDTTCDNWGTFCYIRDVASGEFWSTAYQPTLQRPPDYEAIFSEGRAEFRRRDHGFETHTEIVVSPEEDIELRRVRITNRSWTRKTIDVTSYAEVVLAPPAADVMHPAFSNLFVQTEIIRERRAILCTRRPRSIEEKSPWMFHLLAVHGASIGEVSYETDRMRFIGRGNTVVAPRAMSESGALSGTHGSVLDPIVAIQCQISLDPEQSVTIDMASGIGETREAVLSLVEKYQDRRLADRVFELAWTHSQVVLRQINATETDAQLYSRLASSVIYANASLRADPAVLIKNRRGQSGLWGYAISGDLPIVLLQIGNPAHIDLVRQLVQAHAYWRLKGLAVDLVIWSEDHAGYRQQLQEQIMGLIAAGVEAHVIDRPGGIFVRPAEQISNEDRVLFQSVARAVITDSRGTLAEQIGRRGPVERRVSRLMPTRSHRPEAWAQGALPRRDLILANGLGGFAADGREYVIAPAPGQMTPAPWVNVLANAHFGTVISESGLAYTWAENAHEFRLTPWHNDPVTDSSGEALYLRDEETGHFWSPTSLPSPAVMPHVSRHGFGYSVFEHTSGGIRSELWVYVAIDAAIKFSVLKVRNESGRRRKLSATGYVEWVLGDLRSKSSMHVTTEVDARSGALFARNPYNTDFGDWTTFFDVDDVTRTFTGDRAEFLGRNGTLRNPAAMARSRLFGKTGPALDPCAAIQVSFELSDGQEREVIFRLGVGQDAEAASNLVRRFQGGPAGRSALEAVRQYWKRTLDAVQVETPDESLNVLANGWLLYQTLACRVWARSGYYQSGGAFGFRDQLQDVMALIHAEPRLVREHLLLCASRQFREGDVQHWWHPPSGRGVRTHCSDDYLWLPLATCRYVLSTGDTGVLDEPAHFLEGRPVNAEDDSYYDLPDRSEDVASLYEHCVRAIVRGLRFGERGLPLIGSGDWNDGMNLVGKHGKGESVWLAFFLCEVLKQFAPLARVHGDPSFAERCGAEAVRLRESIQGSGWDGEWYRRAYFDDGSPLGSRSNEECQIDSIAQSWSVISGASDGKRARSAMDAFYERLVRQDDALIQLLDPPFDKSDLNPGYIRGYVPGVRENGGQYTHGAIWAVMAYAVLGDSARAWELLAMINPVNHARSRERSAIYKVEPYVVAADVYAVKPHTGRGGWTWYTGSAGWMYRLMIESLLGLRLEVDKLHIAPCIPVDWKAFKMNYRYRETVYRIAVSQTRDGTGEITMTVDGVEQYDGAIPLVDDRREHSVEVRVHAARV